LKHKNIVRLVRTFEDEGWIFMLMEYCNKGNIHHVQLSRTNNQFTLQETIIIVSEILDGLDYMHSKNLIHRDIKAENILLHSNDPKKGKEALTVKICDLGFVRE
jgi:aurora kinase